MVSKKRRPPALRADERQRGVLRSELHDRVDEIIDALPLVERISREMGMGFSGSTLGDGGSYGSDGTSVTERLAIDPQADPAAQAADALSGWDDAIKGIRRSAARFRRLMPMTDAEVEQSRGRQNDVETCALCQLPAPDGVKRIDGQPYCKSSCYFKVWRSRKATG